ncbi:MAG: hypothetical protein EOL87_07330 [Spartobacteria bacterium]|nr:hypothetical protein [Spartobacteria bacterium]
MKEAMSDKGVQITDHRVGIVSPIVQEDYDLAAFVPTVTVLQFIGMTFRQWGFLNAVSPDGERWYFVDMDGDPRQRLCNVFPNLCSRVQIPLVKDEFAEFVYEYAKDAAN